MAVAAADAPDGSDAKSTLNGGPVSPAIDVAHGVRTETCSTTNTSIPTSICTATGGKAVKVTVAGGWVWYTHGSDCNTDRAGVGFAVDWFDPRDANTDGSNGNSIGKAVLVNGASKVIGVGVKPGDPLNLNTADNVVHPTPRGTDKYGTSNNEIDVEAPAQYKSWRGGCGNVTATQPKLPRGIWGPRKSLFKGSTTFGGTTGTTQAINQDGLSHIYAKADDITTLCVVTYDVHKGTAPSGGGGVGIPSGASEITAGGSTRNSDNGVEKNSGTPLGNACPPIQVPQPNIQVEKLPKNQTVPFGGFASFTIRVTNNGNVDLTNISVSDPNALGCANAIASLAKGTSTDYTCQSGAVPLIGLHNVVYACGDGGGATVCDQDDSDAASLTRRSADAGIEDLTSNQDFVPNDTATLSGAISPAGTITFKLHANSCTGTTLFTSAALTLVQAAAGSGNTLLLSALLGAQGLGPDTAGTYYWEVSYSGDTGATPNASFTECTESYTIDNS